ncbi:MAG: HAMP domain-containing protein [Acidobacteria bacterium]|nr:MAG: HAMP domain-containing protein [Acidobacteriota bacterium]
MATLRATSPDSRGIRTVRLAATRILPAAALAAALAPGRHWGLAALGLAVPALVAVAAGSRRLGPRDSLAALAFLLAAAVPALPDLRPPGEPADLLPVATAEIERVWHRWVDRLDRAVSDPPPAGGGYTWVERRQRGLGPGTGLEVLSADAATTHVWSGWTTVLTPAEREVLLRALDSPPAVLVLRRGLALRLLVARRAAGPPGAGLIVAAERPLPPEPDAGEMARAVPAGVTVRVRWQSIGEGVRARFGPSGPGGPQVAFWSLVPLMVPGSRRAGLASLGMPPAAELAARRADTRRRRAAWCGAAVLAGLALVSGSGWWRFPLARLLLVLAPPSVGPRDWGSLLLREPAGAALTMLALVGVAASVPLGRRAWIRRSALAAGVMLALAGLLATGAGTLAAGGPPTASARFTGLSRLLGVDWWGSLALGGSTWAGLLLAFRAGGARPAVALAAAGLAAGIASGAVHAACLTPAARRRTERGLARSLRERERLWTRDLMETLDLAVPPPQAEVLAPDRDAIDLWWRSPLGRDGLASGVWKYRPGEPDVPSDAFVSGLPPVAPRSRLVSRDPEATGPFPHRIDGPRLVELERISGTVTLLTVESLRPDGGSWVAGVLVAPGNLPGRRGDDPLLRARSGPRPPRVLPDPVLEPRLAWFDEAGRQLGAELDAPPAPPRAPPTRARWRLARLKGRPAWLYEMPDASGTVTAVLVPPDGLTLAAIALGWGLWYGALAAAWACVGALLAAPRRVVGRTVSRLARLAGEFRTHLAVSLVAAGLLPLLVLGAAGRAAARRQAQHQLTSEGASAARIARRLLEDFLAVEGKSAWLLGGRDERDAIASWIARELGEDLFAWENGELVATSRPDLTRAGLWPSRLPGHIERAIAVSRVPLLLEPAFATGPLVAHGPYRAPGEMEAGVLSVPLRGAERRFEAEVVGVDRALVVSAGLLVALAGALLVPATRRLVRPLSQLERATSSIAAGRFDVPVPETGYAETRALARALRAMAESLDRQQRSLERRRAAMEALIESIPVAVVALSPGGVVWAANPQARQLLGAEPGWPLPESGGPLRSAAAALARAGGAKTERVTRREAGETAVYRLEAVDLPGPAGAGDPSRLLVVEDLTDAVRSERLVAWAEMARRIAHEIKNPLTPISLMVDHVRSLRESRDPRLPEVLDRFLGTIAEQVAVLRETAGDFSDYARLLVSRPEPVDLPSRIREWLSPYLLAPPEGVSVNLEGPDRLPDVMADPRLLRRAVVNLVDNALAAVARGGRVQVRWEGDADEVRITVEDDGPGIAPEKVAELLEPDATTRREGSGLGLPIVREAVAAHGGRLEIDTAPGRGARFTIVLPAGTGPAGRAGPSPAGDRG